MDEIIETMRNAADGQLPGVIGQNAQLGCGYAARRIEEVRAFLERFAAGEPPPEGCTYEEWAKELLA